MSRIVIKTTCTATVREEWQWESDMTLDEIRHAEPDLMDDDLIDWLLSQGARLVEVKNVEVYDEQDREVLEVEEV